MKKLILAASAAMLVPSAASAERWVITNGPPNIGYFVDLGSIGHLKLQPPANSYPRVWASDFAPEFWFGGPTTHPTTHAILDVRAHYDPVSPDQVDLFLDFGGGDTAEFHNSGPYLVTGRGSGKARRGLLSSDPLRLGIPGVLVHGGVTFTVGLSRALPEPGTWAMLLVGFAAVGGTMRLRTKKGGRRLADRPRGISR